MIILWFIVLFSHLSYNLCAKAEIFLYYSTSGTLVNLPISAKAEILLCYSTPMSIRYLFWICKSRNFLVLLNFIWYCWRYTICKSRNFLVLLNTYVYVLSYNDLQKQKFSCVTQLKWYHVKNSISAKAEIFLCYSNGEPCAPSLVICKSRNFLVLLNSDKPYGTSVISAKAEIFLCYSTPNSSFCTYFSLNNTVFIFFLYIFYNIVK